MTIRITRNAGTDTWRYTATFSDGTRQNSNSISGLLKKVKVDLELLDEKRALGGSHA